MKDKRKIEKLTISLKKKTNRGKEGKKEEGREEREQKRREKKKEKEKERAMKNISTNCWGQAVL